ncbi:MAG: hypothetical protein WAM11_06145, partial [Cyanobium sp.]
LQGQGSVRLALLMAATGLDGDGARAAMAKHGPGLRSVLAALGAQLPAPPTAAASASAPQ